MSYLDWPWGIRENSYQQIQGVKPYSKQAVIFSNLYIRAALSKIRQANVQSVETRWQSLHSNSGTQIDEKGLGLRLVPKDVDCR